MAPTQYNNFVLFKSLQETSRRDAQLLQLAYSNNLDISMV